MLGEIFLDAHGEILGQLFALPDGIEEESAAVEQTACDVIHVQVSLHVASDKVGGIHQICGADRVVAEAEVGAGEAA